VSFTGQGRANTTLGATCLNWRRELEKNASNLGGGIRFEAIAKMIS
jgi:hypothetical protein